MRNALLIAIPLLWLGCPPVRAEVYKCVTDGRVEYRDVACARGARQEVIEIAATSNSDDAAAKSVAAERLKYLREADAALSARLAHEHELRLQLAAEEAIAARQARAEAERRAATEAQGAVGVYWPVRRWHLPRYHRHVSHRPQPYDPHNYSRDFAGRSIPSLPQRSFSFGAVPTQVPGSR